MSEQLEKIHGNMCAAVEKLKQSQATERNTLGDDKPALEIEDDEDKLISVLHQELVNLQKFIDSMKEAKKIQDKHREQEMIEELEAQTPAEPNVIVSAPSKVVNDKPKKLLS